MALPAWTNYLCFFSDSYEPSKCPKTRRTTIKCGAQLWSSSSNYMCIWRLSKIMVPENCPYAALSRTYRPFAPQQNRDMGLWSGFRLQIRHKDLQEDCIKKHYWLEIRFQSCSSYIPAVRDESVPVHRVDGIGQVSVPVRTFDFWTLVLHPFFEKLLKLRQCRMN